MGRHEAVQRVALQPGVLVEQVGELISFVQGDAQADVVGRAEAQVLPRLDDAHGGIAGADHRKRLVGGAVVDHQHVRLDGGLLQAPEAFLDPFLGIVGHDDDEDISHENT